MAELSSQAEKQKTDMILYNYRKVDEHYNAIKNGERSIAECVKDYVSLSDGEIYSWRKIKPKIFNIGGSFWSAWSKFLKDNNIRFSDYNLCEDHIFTVKSLLKAKKIGYKEKPIYNYMVRIGSASRPINPNDDSMHAVLNTFKQIKAFLADIKLQKELKQEFNKHVSDTTMHLLPKILSQDEFKKQSAEILLQ